jgi:hypothetical protein
MDISEYADVIDSRDIIARIDTLQADLEEIDDDEREELAVLLALSEECAGYASDWTYGEALIRESYWVKYAQELAEDCGFTASDEWPGRHIDWEAAADELSQDYSDVDYRGVTYRVRSY